MERIKISDIKPGMWVKVNRNLHTNAKRSADSERLTLSIGVITKIPDHRLFCEVLFYNKQGKPLYRECFHWIDIERIMPNYRSEKYAEV